MRFLVFGSQEDQSNEITAAEKIKTFDTRTEKLDIKANEKLVAACANTVHDIQDAVSFDQMKFIVATTKD
jgi:hypothetical protein